MDKTDLPGDSMLPFNNVSDCYAFPLGRTFTVRSTVVIIAYFYLIVNIIGIILIS